MKGKDTAYQHFFPLYTKVFHPIKDKFHGFRAHLICRPKMLLILTSFYPLTTIDVFGLFTAWKFHFYYLFNPLPDMPILGSSNSTANKDMM